MLRNQIQHDQIRHDRIHLFQVYERRRTGLLSILGKAGTTKHTVYWILQQQQVPTVIPILGSQNCALSPVAICLLIVNDTQACLATGLVTCGAVHKATTQRMLAACTLAWCNTTSHWAGCCCSGVTKWHSERCAVCSNACMATDLAQAYGWRRIADLFDCSAQGG